MKTILYLLIFLTGFVCASALFIFIIVPKEGRDKFAFGYHNGMVEAQFDIGRRIPAVLGSDVYYSDGHNEFLAVKDLDIVVVEPNGVKTLRDYANVQKN
jgi:hypothetical protein